MTTGIDYLTELTWRGLLHPSATETAPLDAALKAGTVVGYCGFDPTGDSLHVGHLLPLMGLVHLQRSNNRPVALIGGGTGLIGDPSGKSAERPMAERGVIEDNARKIRAQIAPFLAEGPYTVVDNADWLGQLNLIEFLRDIGKHFSVNVMLQRESVRSRMEVGISFTEFSYMLLQAYDYLKLHQLHGANLQIGGSDQWGNIAAGVDLIRRMTGDTAHGLTMHLITTASGTKFGKTESGAVWLDPEKTSPYQFYQFWINVDDRDVGRYLRYFTLLDREHLEGLDQSVAVTPEHRIAQQRLALDVTTRVHDRQQADLAKEISLLLFERGDPRLLSTLALENLEKEIPFATVEAVDGKVPDVIDLLVATKLAASKSVARRLLDQGGVSVNNIRVDPNERAIPTDRLLEGGRLLLRKGARDYALVRVTGL